MSDIAEHDMQPLTSGSLSSASADDHAILDDNVSSHELRLRPCFALKCADAQLIVKAAKSCKRPRLDGCCCVILYLFVHFCLRETVACICILAIAATAAALGVAVLSPSKLIYSAALFAYHNVTSAAHIISAIWRWFYTR
jgi:hypothetical protein